MPFISKTDKTLPIKDGSNFNLLTISSKCKDSFSKRSIIFCSSLLSPFIVFLASDLPYITPNSMQISFTDVISFAPLSINLSGATDNCEVIGPGTAKTFLLNLNA
jgi:hypothetical protein